MVYTLCGIENTKKAPFPIICPHKKKAFADRRIKKSRKNDSFDSDIS
jgi:hypothetical protein